MQIKPFVLLSVSAIFISLFCNGALSQQMQQNEEVDKKPKPRFTDTNIAALSQVQKYIRFDMFDAALQVCNKVLLENPKDLQIRLMRAEVYARLENYEKAEEDWDYIIKHFPNYQNAVQGNRHRFLPEDWPEQRAHEQPEDAPLHKEEHAATKPREGAEISTKWLVPGSIIAVVVLAGVVLFLLLRRKGGGQS